jgi:multicomponent Na+:H+ antiporter subunit E
MKRINPRNIILHFILMMTFWLIMSGMFDFFHISMGVLSVVIVLWVNSKLRNYNFFDEEEHRAAEFKVLRLFYFIAFLVWEIISSSFRIAYLIIHPKMPIKTGLIKFKTNLPNMNARVLLGNSITLTPGTVTLQIDKDGFLIHSLTNEAAEAHIDHSLAVEVAKLYGTDAERVVHDEVIIKSEDEL